MGPLPSGIVSFVFTDIEGSTRLLKRLGGLWPVVLERHRVLLRAAWLHHGGAEINVEGDAFFVAFADADAAVASCATVQRALGAEPWPVGGEVQVRIGVHCGLASPLDDDYVALAVHQAARVVAAAHGGQVLLSHDAAGRAGRLQGLELVPLGRFRLRDFDEPEHLYQLAGDGLRASFPAPRAMPAETHNLVPAPTSFVGRHAERHHVASLLGRERIVTLVGPGGVGKTRLATEVGLAAVADWEDGVWVVDLVAVEDPDAIPDGVASAVGVPEGGHDRWDDVLSHLADRRALVVLDNAEHHLDRCAVLVRDLVRSCPRVGVIVTSRAPLHVAGEVVARLAPLPTPGLGAGDEELQGSASVQLFLDRARSAGAAVEEMDLAVVAAISRRLDGLPLALEIAAARATVLDPTEILAGLDTMPGVLRSPDRTRHERQRSIDSLLDWSHRLLGPEEQAALRRLAVLPGGFDLPLARAAVADGRIPCDDVPELVWSLVDASLLTADPTANQTRYRFLETVRQFASTRLAEAGEEAEVASRLGAVLLEAVGPCRSPDRRWIGTVGQELDNLRSILGVLARTDQEAAQQLAVTVGRYRDAVGDFRGGIVETGRYVAELVAPTPSRVALLTTVADLHLRLGEIAEAEPYLAQAAELAREVGPAPWDDAGVARSQGEVLLRSGRPAQAAVLAKQVLGRGVSPRGVARMSNMLGLARYMEGDLPAAFEAFGDERAAHVAGGHEAFVAAAEGNLAEVALRMGCTATAARHQSACLELAVALGQPVMVAYSLMVAARLAGARQQWVTAARLHAKADAVLAETGQPLYDDDLRVGRELCDAARVALGADAYAEVVAEGLRLDLGTAAAAAGEVLYQARATEEDEP